MYKYHKWANMSAGRPSNAPPPPDPTGSGSDSGSSNGKTTPRGGRRAQEHNKKQKTEDVKQTEGQARQRRGEDKEVIEIHAQLVRTVDGRDSYRWEVVDKSSTVAPDDDVKNGNADDQGRVESDMEVEEEAPESSTGSGATEEERPSSGGPAGETHANAGDGQAHDMDTDKETENLVETPKVISDAKDNDGGGDHVAEEESPETLSDPDEPTPAEIKAIKNKAANLSKKSNTMKSTDPTKDKKKPNTNDTKKSEKLKAKGTKVEKLDAKPPERQQPQAGERDTWREKSQGKPQQQPPEYQYQREEWGITAGYDHQRPGHAQRVSAQKDIQTQRSLQASKQMAYQVFANVLTAIEEQENREAKKYKKQPERSEAFIPDQSWKKDDDVIAGVEAQLTVFQAHMRFCPREVAEAAKVEMIDTTLHWAAARQEIDMPATPTDVYAINLLEILYDGATSNTFQMLKESRKTFGRSELMENVGKIMAGQAKADHLDKQFKDDPRKEAKALPIRQGQNISDGIVRLLSIARGEGMNRGIRKHLKEHLETVSAR